MRSVLNEEGITDIFASVAKSAADRATEKRKTGKSYYIGGSISKYTKGLIMSFPVLCDDSLSLDAAMNISKANEKNITSMMEMLFASMSINGKQGMTGKDVIGIFHRNIDTMPIDDYIDAANNYIANYVNSEAGELLPRVKDSVVREAARDMIAELKLPHKSFPVSSFSESSINDYMTREVSGKVAVYEYDGYRNTSANKYNIPTYSYNATNTNQPDYDAVKLDLQKQRDDETARNNRLKTNLDYQKYNYQRNRDNYNDNRDAQNDINQRLNNQNQFNQKRILDSDFKKANELQPTMLVVNFNVLGDDNQTVIDRSSFIAGIKCRMIATTSLDITERLISVRKQKLSFKDLIRATTGEISFTKDFLLALKQQRIDAKNNAKRGEAAKLWNTLKNRSMGNNYRKLSRDGNDASAITTLIVSQDTANYLKATNKIDLASPKIAMDIMDAYNLLCLVVADDSNEVAKFLYDGNKNFDTLSYSVLSKEANDKALRRELNLIQQAKKF